MAVITRIIEFPIESVVEADYTTTVLKNITVKIIVTTPNKYGVFKIITQIGDETPNVRETSIKNENVVKSIKPKDLYPLK